MTDPWIGRTYEGCRLDAQIAASASAHLYRATLLARQEAVSVALLHPGPKRKLPGPSVVQQVHWTLRNHPHPGVALVQHARTVDGQLLLVMDALQGETMQQAYRRGPLASGAVVQLTHDLAAALDHLHQLDLVHGHIAPTRILLTPKGACLLELGAADPAKKTSKSLDILAVGYCLYIAATGRAASRNMPPTASVAPTLPQWICALIDDCRSRDAGRRPVDGAALLARVKRQLASIPARSTPISDPSTAHPLVPEPKLQPPMTPPNGAPRRTGEQRYTLSPPSVTLPSHGRPPPTVPSSPSPEAAPVPEAPLPEVASLPPVPAVESRPPPTGAPLAAPALLPPPPLVHHTGRPTTEASEAPADATEPIPELEPTVPIQAVEEPDILEYARPLPPSSQDSPAVPSEQEFESALTPPMTPTVAPESIADPESSPPSTVAPPEPLAAPDSTAGMPPPPSSTGPHPALVLIALAAVVILGITGIFGAAWYMSGSPASVPLQAQPIALEQAATPPKPDIIEAPPDPDQTARLTITNRGGRPIHLSCTSTIFGSASDTGDAGIEEAMMHTDSFTREDVPLGTRCTAVEPSSGAPLWRWTADTAPDQDDGWDLTITDLPPGPRPAATPRASVVTTAPAPTTPAPRRPLPPPPPAATETPTGATLSIVPSSKRKRRREGIEVRVDGMKRGLAPVKLREFPLGTHRIEATWEGQSVSCVMTLKGEGMTVGVDPAGKGCARQ
ncbi:MAG: hypothetical protein CL927_14085 [Deltaproteobacteria bacterium]|nr:hypothetical protein [Deltaproteobacteria bacterium]